MTRISFITSVKICAGYEDYGHRVRLYIENTSRQCDRHSIEYEILISEDVCERNTKPLSEYLTPEFLEGKNVTLFKLQQTYDNPYGHNMLESPNKNLCLQHAKGEYVCMTSADVLMNDAFYQLLSRTEDPRLYKNVFYRFLTYEVAVTPKPISTYDSEAIMRHCEQNTNRCYNENLRHARMISDIAYKSGDIMLMDRENWLKIKGFPMCGIFHHTDYVVCLVVQNNRISICPVLDPIKVYGIIQEGRDKSGDSTEPEQWRIASTFRNKLTCN